MPDTDSPYVFGLPDNIERSLQRTLSTSVVAQLRALSASGVGAGVFDREKWRAQVCIYLYIYDFIYIYLLYTYYILYIV